MSTCFVDVVHNGKSDYFQVNIQNNETQMEKSQIIICRYTLVFPPFVMIFIKMMIHTTFRNPQFIFNQCTLSTSLF